MLYQDRKEGGKKLSSLLQQYAGRDDVLVLGILKGGLAVAHEVARELQLPFNFVIVSKIQPSGHSHVALAAITEMGIYLSNDQLISLFGYSPEMMEKLLFTYIDKTEELSSKYRERYPMGSLEQYKTVILVDDGIASGVSMKAAVLSLQRMGVQKIVVASPVASLTGLSLLKKVVDDVRVLSTPFFFSYLHNYYEKFPKIADTEIEAMLSDMADSFACEQNIRNY